MAAWISFFQNWAFTLFTTLLGSQSWSAPTQKVLSPDIKKGTQTHKMCFHWQRTKHSIFFFCGLPVQIYCQTVELSLWDSALKTGLCILLNDGLCWSECIANPKVMILVGISILVHLMFVTLICQTSNGVINPVYVHITSDFTTSHPRFQKL